MDFLEGLKKLEEAATAGPWEARDIAGVGWKIFAKLRAWKDKLLAFYESPLPRNISLQFSDDGVLYATMAYETWCQFPAPGWNEELAANMQLVVALRNKAKEFIEMGEAAKELADLVDAIIEGEYTPDSFTTQPVRIALRNLERRDNES